MPAQLVGQRLLGILRHDLACMPDLLVLVTPSALDSHLGLSTHQHHQVFCGLASRVQHCAPAWHGHDDVMRQCGLRRSCRESCREWALQRVGDAETAAESAPERAVDSGLCRGNCRECLQEGGCMGCMSCGSCWLLARLNSRPGEEHGLPDPCSLVSHSCTQDGTCGTAQRPGLCVPGLLCRGTS